MSIERIKTNFQKFLQNVRDLPERQIEKTKLIQMLNEFVAQNPELENIYDAVSTVEPQPDEPEIDHYSFLVQEENPIVSVGPAVSTRESSYGLASHLVEKVSIHQGELKVRKESAVLSPLVKKTVFGELSAAYHDSQKLLYFTIYQSQKSQKVIHKFILDESCSFIRDRKSKHDFTFQHNSSSEFFTTESGVAESWISRFESMLSQSAKPEVYVDFDKFSSSRTSTSTNNESIRPPPRPAARQLNPKPILPSNIFVCLYDHFSTTKNQNELEFLRGDLLHIVNRDGPEFYVGHKITSICQTDSRAPLGLVFKDFIQPAYEKIH